MRTRAYRPEVPDCLEGRSLLSGVAGPSAGPVVLAQIKFNEFVIQVRSSFELFGRERNFTDLGSGLDQAAAFLPFGQVDLVRPMNRILDELRQELAAHVPHAVRSAYNEVLALARADVGARLRAGDIVVR